MKRSIILCFLSLALVHIGCKSSPEGKEESVKLKVTSPLRRDTVIYKVYVAQIRSHNHIEVRSQEKGYLQQVFVDEGQFVKKGQLLFQIMPVIYQAELQKAKANVSFAEIEYDNTRSLADSNIVSRKELALARATLDKEKAELALAQAHLEFTEIRAPFDGYIDHFYERLGSLIDEGALLTSLSDNSKMWVYFNVPEAEYLDYIVRDKKGEKQKVQLQMANNQLFDQQGIVETIEADFNNETGNIAFRATFSNPKQVLRHGQTGNILLPVVLKYALIIPQESTFDVLDKKFVYVVDKDGLLKSRQITVAHELPHLYIISAGLEPGEKILLEGLGKVKNNERIEQEFVSFSQVEAELMHIHAE